MGALVPSQDSSGSGDDKAGSQQWQQPSLPLQGHLIQEEFSHGRSMERERGWRNRQYGDNMIKDVRDGSDGNQMARDGRVASDDQQDGDDDI
ncbi:hypothetical protein ACLOJK_038895 [Asimina triloba]